MGGTGREGTVPGGGAQLGTLAYHAGTLMRMQPLHPLICSFMPTLCLNALPQRILAPAPITQVLHQTPTLTASKVSLYLPSNTIALAPLIFYITPISILE